MKNKKFKIAIISASALVIFCIAVFLTVFFQKGIVPNVIGKTEDDAKNMLSEMGFLISTTEEYSDTVPKGFVISQDKEPKTEIRKFTKVGICLSRGIEQVQVPDVVGLNSEEAKKVISESKLTFKIIESYHSEIEKGKIIRQSAFAGVKLSKNSEIVLTVSLGKEMVTVPALKGVSLNKATKELENLGFKIDYDIKCNTKIKEDCIISQDLKAGNEVEKGSAIKLLVSTGRPNTKGNSNGNSINSGMVSAQGNWIYYVNYQKDCFIYKMRPDGSEKQLVVKDVATSLNVVGEWIYYSAESGNPGIYKVKLNGKERTKISDDHSRYMNVVGDWIFYCGTWHAGGPLYKMKTDGSKKTRIGDDNCTEINIVGDKIYYRNYDNNLIYQIDIDGKNKKLLNNSYGATNLAVCGSWLVASGTNSVLETVPDAERTIYLRLPNGQLSFLNSANGFVYALQMEFSAKNQDAKYSFCRFNPELGSTETIKYIDYKNTANYYLCVIGDWIYFSNDADNGYMYRLNINNKKLENLCVK